MTGEGVGSTASAVHLLSKDVTEAIPVTTTTYGKNLSLLSKRESSDQKDDNDTIFTLQSRLDDRHGESGQRVKENGQVRSIGAVRTDDNENGEISEDGEEVNKRKTSREFSYFQTIHNSVLRGLCNARNNNNNTKRHEKKGKDPMRKYGDTSNVSHSVSWKQNSRLSTIEDIQAAWQNINKSEEVAIGLEEKIRLFHALNTLFLQTSSVLQFDVDNHAADSNTKNSEHHHKTQLIFDTLKFIASGIAKGSTIPDECLNVVIGNVIESIGYPDLRIQGTATEILERYLCEKSDNTKKWKTVCLHGIESNDISVSREVIVRVSSLISKSIVKNSKSFANIQCVVTSLSRRLTLPETQQLAFIALGKLSNILGPHKFTKLLDNINFEHKRLYLRLSKEEKNDVSTKSSVFPTDMGNSNEVLQNPERKKVVKSPTYHIPLMCVDVDVRDEPKNDNVTAETKQVNQSSSWIEYGLIEDSVIEKLKNDEDVEKRIEGAIQLKKTLEETDDLSPFKNQIKIFLNLLDSLLDERSVKMNLLTLDVYCVLIKKIGSSECLKGNLNLICTSLLKHTSHSRVVVRIENYRIIKQLMIETKSPHLVLLQFFDHIGDKRTAVREAIIDILICSLLTFPSYEFDLRNVASIVVPTLVDPKRRIRHSALECIAILAAFLGPNKANPLISSIGLLEKHFERGGGLMKAVQARLHRRQLPRISQEGLVEYGLQLTSSQLVEMSSKKNWNASEITHDIRWILAGSGSIRGGSAKAVVALEDRTPGNRISDVHRSHMDLNQREDEQQTDDEGETHPINTSSYARWKKYRSQTELSIRRNSQDSIFDDDMSHLQQNLTSLKGVHQNTASNRNSTNLVLPQIVPCENKTAGSSAATEDSGIGIKRESKIQHDQQIRYDIQRRQHESLRQQHPSSKSTTKEMLEHTKGRNLTRSPILNNSVPRSRMLTSPSSSSLSSLISTKSSTDTMFGHPFDQVSNYKVLHAIKDQDVKEDSEEDNMTNSSIHLRKNRSMQFGDSRDLRSTEADDCQIDGQQIKMLSRKPSLSKAAVKPKYSCKLRNLMCLEEMRVERRTRMFGNAESTRMSKHDTKSTNSTTSLKQNVKPNGIVPSTYASRRKSVHSNSSRQSTTYKQNMSRSRTEMFQKVSMGEQLDGGPKNLTEHHGSDERTMKFSNSKVSSKVFKSNPNISNVDRDLQNVANDCSDSDDDGSSESSSTVMKDFDDGFTTDDENDFNIRDQRQKFNRYRQSDNRSSSPSRIPVKRDSNILSLMHETSIHKSPTKLNTTSIKSTSEKPKSIMSRNMNKQHTTDTPHDPGRNLVDERSPGRSILKQQPTTSKDVKLSEHKPTDGGTIDAPGNIHHPKVEDIVESNMDVVDNSESTRNEVSSVYEDQNNEDINIEKEEDSDSQADDSESEHDEGRGGEAQRSRLSTATSVISNTHYQNLNVKVIPTLKSPFENFKQLNEPCDEWKKPHELLEEGIESLQSSEAWEKNVSGMGSVVRLVRNHPDTLTSSHLKTLTTHLLMHVKNLRSQVSRAGVNCIGELFIHMKRQMETSELENIVTTLILRSGDTNKFLREDCQVTLDHIIENVYPSKIVHVLNTNELTNHKSCVIRATVSRVLAHICQRVRIDRSLSSPLADKIVPMLVKFSQDGSQQARNFAKLTLVTMLEEKGSNEITKIFSRYCVSANSIRNMTKIINVLSTKEENSKMMSLRSTTNNKGSKMNVSYKGLSRFGVVNKASRLDGANDPHRKTTTLHTSDKSHPRKAL